MERVHRAGASAPVRRCRADAYHRVRRVPARHGRDCVARERARHQHSQADASECTEPAPQHRSWPNLDAKARRAEAETEAEAGELITILYYNQLLYYMHDCDMC